MAIKIETKDNINQIHIEGDLTIYEVADYLDKLKQNLMADKAVELDLGAVEELDTSGLQLITAVCKQASDNGADIRFVAMSDEVDEAVHNCRLLHALGCEQEEAAS